jgi:hypothetical protein
MSRSASTWPEAPTDGWLETSATIQTWSQMVGKMMLAKAPPANHWWHIALHFTARGLTTLAMPDGRRSFQIDFDFLDHQLSILTSDGGVERMALAARPIPEFYAEFTAKLRALGIDVAIWPVPVETPTAVPFTEDRRDCEYRPEIAERLFRILLLAHHSLQRFRNDFVGKSSPSHFFWGSFDLALTRFSGRRAPEHPGGVPNLADWVTREAYSHEVASCGFWPGTAGGFERPAFYAYAYPEPSGFAEAAVEPPGFYSDPLREYLLPYDDVRMLADPDAAVLAFLRSTYAAAADLGGWDRKNLEHRARARAACPGG